MVRGRDACWEHCVLVDATRQKVRCNYCHREFSGGVYRMKFHLAQIKNKDIVPCAEVPDDVRDHIRVILSTPKKQKTPKKLRVDRAAIAQQNSSSASGGAHPNHGSSGQHGSTGPSLLFPRPSPSAQPEVDDARKKKQDDADKKIAMATTDRDKIEITKEHPIYINAQGALGTEFAIMGRTLNSPDVSSEWPTELEPSNPLLDDSWLDNLPLDCGGSP
ncbi:hypothetical protein H0E87_002709 [Populus deltoides]|uniref:BED-type domain-containing protein n=1 Tax=Populus deltoides TaxID=3696 RepID=A0A8T2ZYH0_POPDE|nr:hypothetical protein H0E87_002709 [Populus deltoides]